MFEMCFLLSAAEFPQVITRNNSGRKILRDDFFFIKIFVFMRVRVKWGGNHWNGNLIFSHASYSILFFVLVLMVLALYSR